MRIGTGYDVHRLVPDRKMIIGGVEIPYELGLLGHSDADVLLHAISDAILGAAALGDIGKHFPDIDPQYKGISSIKLLEHVAALLDENGYVVENIDATIIAQRPKMRPYIDQMRENIAKALGVETDQINVKATTEEGLGFTGTGEGISSQAICAIEKYTNYSSIDVAAPTGRATVWSSCARPGSSPVMSGVTSTHADLPRAHRPPRFSCGCGKRACARKHNHKTIGSAEPAAPPICTKEFSHV